MKKFIKWFTLALFLLLLIAPQIISLATPFRFQKLEEYRKESELPQASAIFSPDWTKEFSNWFNDHFFLRPALVRLAGSLYYHLFKFSDRVYVGKDNMMYYRNVIDNQLFKNYLSNRDGGFSHFFTLVEKAKRKLARKGITLVVVVCPQKYVLYPQNLPNHIPNGIDHSFADVYKRLSRIDGIIPIDVLPILEATGQKGIRTYHVTDFHWTDPAAYTVAQEILQKIANREAAPLATHPLAIEDLDHFVGGQSRFLPLFDPIEEKTISVKKNWDDTKVRYADVNLRRWEFISENPDAALGPAALLGNSFSDGFIRSGFPLYFKKLYRFNRGLPLLTAVSLVPKGTTYFIWQIIEVELATVK